jgi:hypothetical protein
MQLDSIRNCKKIQNKQKKKKKKRKENKNAFLVAKNRGVQLNQAKIL